MLGLLLLSSEWAINTLGYHCQQKSRLHLYNARLKNMYASVVFKMMWFNVSSTQTFSGHTGFLLI